VKKARAQYFNWRFNNKTRTLPRGKKLRLLLMDRATVHWSFDNWQTSHDTDTQDSGWNLEHADLPTEALLPGHKIAFTFYWKHSKQWEGRDFEVTVE
jgi:glucoamylase